MHARIQIAYVLCLVINTAAIVLLKVPFISVYNRGSFNFAFGVEILLRVFQTSRVRIIVCMCVIALLRFSDYYIKWLFLFCNFGLTLNIHRPPFGPYSFPSGRPRSDDNDAVDSPRQATRHHQRAYNH